MWQPESLSEAHILDQDAVERDRNAVQRLFHSKVPLSSSSEWTNAAALLTVRDPSLLDRASPRLTFVPPLCTTASWIQWNSVVSTPAINAKVSLRTHHGPSLFAHSTQPSSARAPTTSSTASWRRAGSPNISISYASKTGQPWTPLPEPGRVVARINTSCCCSDRSLSS